MSSVVTGSITLNVDLVDSASQLPSSVTTRNSILRFSKTVLPSSPVNLFEARGSYTPNNDVLSIATFPPNYRPRFMGLVVDKPIGFYMLQQNTVTSGVNYSINVIPIDGLFCFNPSLGTNQAVLNAVLDGQLSTVLPDSVVQGVPINYYLWCCE